MKTTAIELAEFYVDAASRFNAAYFKAERETAERRQNSLIRAARNIGQEELFWDHISELATDGMDAQVWATQA